MNKTVSLFLIVTLSLAMCTGVFAANGSNNAEASELTTEQRTLQTGATTVAYTESTAQMSTDAQNEDNFDPLVDYSNMMIAAAIVGDYQSGYAAQDARNEKIAELGLTYPAISFDDFMLIAKIIWAEAGSEWLSDEWKMCVGEVVLNRVASPEFPNTVAEVLAQPGQYYGANSRYFNNIIPTERCAVAAMRLLNGERVINDPSVVFQANFRQGGGVHTACYDKHLGWTYFCYSRNVSLYD